MSNVFPEQRNALGLLKPLSLLVGVVAAIAGPGFIFDDWRYSIGAGVLLSIASGLYFMDYLSDPKRED